MKLTLSLAAAIAIFLQTGQNPRGQKNQKDDGQQNQRNDGQQNQNDDGQVSQVIVTRVNIKTRTVTVRDGKKVLDLRIPVAIDSAKVAELKPETKATIRLSKDRTTVLEVRRTGTNQNDDGQTSQNDDGQRNQKNDCQKNQKQ